jgi:NADPH:quinone reductase-like Zn-dependent oxidoreductase
MRRLELTTFGPATDSLVLTETSAPQLTSDQLLIRMEAAPLNGSDFMLIQGMYPVRPALPSTIGAEGVGRVVKTGDGARKLEGRRVVILPTYRQGTWAEELVADQNDVVAVDDATDPLQLAMLAINPLTAYMLLKQFKHLAPGDWIGQTAANSSVGQNVIQLAKLSGLKTLNVVRRPEAAEFVRGLGADAVLLQGENLGKEIDAVLGGERLSLVLDGLGGETIGTLMHFLKGGGAGVGYSLQTGVPPQVSPLDLFFNGLSLHGFWMINWLRNAPREEVQETYAHLASLLAEGKLSAKIEQTYKLDEFKDAVSHAQKAGRSGKILFSF